MCIHCRKEAVLYNMLERKKKVNQECFTWKNYYSELKNYSFKEKQKLKKFITTKVTLEEMLKKPL